MEELIYVIDNLNSDQNGAFAINIQVARKNGFQMEAIKIQPTLTETSLLKFFSARDTNLLKFLIKEEALFQKTTFKVTLDKNKTPLNKVHISHRSIDEALKQFAISGKLYFGSKALAIDLYSKVIFFYLAKGSNVDAYLQVKEDRLKLSALSFIGRGPPHFFIHGMMLKLISNDVSWKDLKAASENKIRPLKDLLEDATIDEQSPQIVIDGEIEFKKEAEPLPMLSLKDPLGSFAVLKMDYGNGQIVDYQEASFGQQDKARNGQIEASWEKDLLETDFIKKIVGNSDYYCPLDKVSKSLAFLLEIGWKVIDYKGNQVLLQNKIELEADLDNRANGAIIIKGKVNYGSFDADISHIIGSFNRRERFAKLAEGYVALLPNNFENSGLDSLVNEGEIEDGFIKVKKGRIGSLTDLFESKTCMRTSLDLELLKQKLKGFEGTSDSTLLQNNQTFPSIAFMGQLRPYQQEGLNWLNFLHDFSFHGLLADDMGLGKTVQTIAFLSTKDFKRPILIVMPTSLIFNWKREFEKFLPSLSVIVHHGKERRALPTDLSSKVILTTYTTLRLDLQQFSSLKYDCLILDEAQVIKNSGTQTFQAVMKLDSSFRLSITGTPVENNINELWSHFNFLMPDLLGTEIEFRGECQAGMSDPRFLRRIKRTVRPFILRRRKSEVAKDLPEKIEQTIFVEMGEKQREIYESYLSGVRKNLLKKVSVDGASKHRMEILEAIMRLRQICCDPRLVDGEMTEKSAKLDTLMQDLETAISAGSKILVYSQFTSMLSLISRRVKEMGWKFVSLDGKTSDREKVVSEFQNNPDIPLFLISLKAGGIGLNLTAADYVFLYDPWWNNAAENQAIDRAHRIGRKDTVIAKRYIVKESIEEKMMKLKEAKSALASELLDDDSVQASISADDLLFLFQ